ncbi:MAG: TrkA family potassium uptake protein [Geobacteraceae bacterium]|nr:TrkA family potassium uptake protein [Geobacteraceae bacterium]
MEVIIVGGGKVGTYLATLLSGRGETVKVIESSREEFPLLMRILPPGSLVTGSGSDPAVLEIAGIRSVDVVAAVTGSDETNLVVAGLARFEFGVRRVIARINHPANAWMFTPRMGVDVALNQADLLVHLILEEMSVGEMMTLLKLRKGEYSLVAEKVHGNSPAVGKTIAMLNLPDECVITAVIRKGKLTIPRGNLVLHAEDEVLSVIHSSRIALLAALLGEKEGEK